MYRLISAGCIEEQMYLRQVYKQQMALALLHPEIKQKRFFKGVMKIRHMQGELFGERGREEQGTFHMLDRCMLRWCAFLNLTRSIAFVLPFVLFAGVRNLFDFSPETGFSAKLLRREADLESGYVIKLDALRKIKEKTDRAVAARSAAALAAADGSPAIGGAEPAASPSPSAAAAAVAASASSALDEPPRKKPRPDPSGCAVVSFEGAEGRAPPGGMALLEAEARDEHDGLVDEYALSFVAADATLLPPDDPLEASVLPAISEEEEDAKGEVDLSVLLRDDDDEEDEMVWSDGEGEENDEDEDPSSAAAAAGAGAAGPRKSNVGPSSAAVHSALSGSGMIGRHEFQSVTKGSRMEQRISKTANKVFSSDSLMLKAMGGSEEAGRAAAARGRRGGRGGMGGGMRMHGGKSASRSATMVMKPAPAASGVSKSPPAVGAAGGDEALRSSPSPDALMHPPSPTAPYSLESLPPVAAAAAASGSPPPPSPPPAAAAAAAAPASSSSSSGPSSRALLTAKLDKFAAMAARYGFTSPSDFARWLQNKDNCSKTDVNSMIEASRHDSQRNTQGDA